MRAKNHIRIRIPMSEDHERRTSIKTIHSIATRKTRIARTIYVMIIASKKIMTTCIICVRRIMQGELKRILFFYH